MPRFEKEDWTLFRSLDGLCQRAGVPRGQLAALVAKELVDNALDAVDQAIDDKAVDDSCEDPSCRVGLLPGENGFWVEDDGAGISDSAAEIESLFSIQRPMRSSKLDRRPTRGALGNGLRVVVGAVIASGGTLIVRTCGQSLNLDFANDGTTSATSVGSYGSPGTRIEVRFGESFKVCPADLTWAREAIALSNGQTRYSGKSSAHWYDSVSFWEHLQAAVGQTVREVVNGFASCSGPKASQIAERFKNRPATSLTREEADDLLEVMREMSKPVNPHRLGRLGAHLRGLPSTCAKVTGSFDTQPAQGRHVGEIPYVIEAYAERSKTTSCRVYVNRTPITSMLSAWTEKRKVGIQGCGFATSIPVGKGGMCIRINIQTPHMPITSDGKTPDLTQFEIDLEKALTKAIRGAKRKVVGDTGESGPNTKEVILRHLEEAIAKASGPKKIRFSIRQLYYVIRPYVLKYVGSTLEYKYFSTVIAKYEAKMNQDIPGMYRDARGIVYHPHTREVIQLGTLQVEAYARPRLTFNKILYCEKEGLFPTLLSVRFPERFDCALMTSKGYASRAARDLLDRLAGTEDLQIFCIHDADAAGTMIYQSLQKATVARPGRKVEIIDLGLSPQEAIEMGLEIEPVQIAGRKRQAVATGISEELTEWLQENRVELNAMPAPMLVEWLEKKMAPYIGKVVPPADVLREQLKQDVHKKLEERLKEEALRRANIPAQLALELEKRRASLEEVSLSLEEQVGRHLANHAPDLWTKPVAQIADVIAGKITPEPDSRLAG